MLRCPFVTFHAIPFVTHVGSGGQSPVARPGIGYGVSLPRSCRGIRFENGPVEVAPGQEVSGCGRT